MMKNFMLTLAFCLCTATLFAQKNAEEKDRASYKRQAAGYDYSKSSDDQRRKSGGQIMDSIRNSSQWKAESGAFIAELYNSAAWKKSKEESARALPLWDEHSTTGNKAWQDAVGKSNAELENSEAYKIYQAKVKDFNRRLDQEIMKQLYKDDPRYRTAF